LLLVKVHPVGLFRLGCAPRRRFAAPPKRWSPHTIAELVFPS
jgi:hypothetical protein